MLSFTLQCTSNCTSAGIFRAWEFHYWHSFTRKKNKIWSALNRARAHGAIDLRIDISIWYSMPETMRGSRKKKSKNEEKMCVSSNIRSFEARRRLNWYGIKVFFQLLSGTRKGRKLANVGLRPRTLDGKSQPDIVGFSPSLNWTLSPSHYYPRKIISIMRHSDLLAVPRCSRQARQSYIMLKPLWKQRV